MSLSDVCTKEYLTFLHYLNEYYLIYSIIILTFIAVFTLVFILQRYTYFEKKGITRGKLPKIPYGNFKEVILQENSLHVFMWKYYNLFKRKNCRYGGLFLFIKPVFVDANHRLVSRKDTQQAKNILDSKTLTAYVKKFYYNISKHLPEKLIQGDITVLTDFLFESVCLAYGFQPLELAEEINQFLKEKYATSLKYFLKLGLPFVSDNQTKPNNDLVELFLEIMENRKKNDVNEPNLIQSFIDLHNESPDLSAEEVACAAFSLFADVLTFSHSTLVFCLYELAENHEIQEQLIGEIRRFNKKFKTISYDDFKELTYLEATVKETLRKYPPVATTIGKYSGDHPSIPEKNALVLKSILGIHRDPRNYTKPDSFDPDRFLEESFDKEIFAPFGDGYNADIYNSLITLQVSLFLISILSRAEVKLKFDGPIKFDPKVLYLKPAKNPNFSFIRI